MSIFSEMGTAVKNKIDALKQLLLDGTVVVASSTNSTKLENNSLSQVVEKSNKGFKNILHNPKFDINQRVFNNDWASLSVGAYGYDRWYKVNSTTIAQKIESINYKPNTVYTLSGTNLTTQQLTSPSSGNWTITVPIGANNIQLEEGSIATSFENRPIGLELSLCQRYYQVDRYDFSGSIVSNENTLIGRGELGSMRANPTVAITLLASSGFWTTVNIDINNSGYLSLYLTANTTTAIGYYNILVKKSAEL